MGKTVVNHSIFYFMADGMLACIFN